MFIYPNKTITHSLKINHQNQFGKLSITINIYIDPQSNPQILSNTTASRGYEKATDVVFENVKHDFKRNPYLNRCLDLTF